MPASSADHHTVGNFVSQSVVKLTVEFMEGIFKPEKSAVATDQGFYPYLPRKPVVKCLPALPK